MSAIDWAFWQEVRRARGARWMSAQDLVDQMAEHDVRIARSTLAKMESNCGRQVRLEEAVVIAGILGLSLDRLV